MDGTQIVCFSDELLFGHHYLSTGNLDHGPGGACPAHLFPYQAEDGTMGAAHFQSIDANTLTPKFPNITIPIYYWFPNVRFPKLFQLFQVASGLHVTSCYGSSCRRKGSLDDVRCSFTKTWEFHMSYSWVDMIQSGNCGFTWMAVFFLNGGRSLKNDGFQ